MASTFTNNLQLELQAAGDNSGTWGDPTLNQNVFTRIDAAMGTTTSIALASSNVTLTQTQWRSANLVLTGALGANVNLVFPLNVNSLTVAVGGTRVIDNQCTGNFTVTVKTEASGSTGVVVSQGVKSVVTSDTANVFFSDSRLGTTDILRIPTVAGSPVGVTTGVAGTAFAPGSLVADRTNRRLWMSSADGTSWVPQSGFFPSPQGYLTPTSGTAIIAGDVTAATAVYYTPYVGNAVPIYDGSWLQAYFFSEMTLTLTSSQAASQIYDVFAFLDSGTLRIGTGPAWATPTAGSGARGTGAGTTQLSRINGLWTNTVSMTTRNGASTYSVAASQGTYLGSLFMDGTNGQVSCYRSYGQSRKWGIWNAYNRANLLLQAGDGTSSWTYATNTIRPSNNSTANSMSIFCGLAEEQVHVNFTQFISVISTAAGTPIGIGWNSTTAYSGRTGEMSSGSGTRGPILSAEYLAAPALGVNVTTCLEEGLSGTVTFNGTITDMLLISQWRG